MKHWIFSLFTFFAAAALAQAPAKEPAKPEPMKEAAKAEPAKAEPAKAEAAKEKKAAARTGPRRWNEDARHCLERGSNTEIIKCAEEFL
ncbi:MAG TPA: hypothetical protein VM756_01375 [Burkholderiales bacterium]|nr:hypothetical protein [Burkholderiales bacterium]